MDFSFLFFSFFFSFSFSFYFFFFFTVHVLTGCRVKIRRMTQASTDSTAINEKKVDSGNGDLENGGFGNGKWGPSRQVHLE